LRRKLKKNNLKNKKTKRGEHLKKKKVTRAKEKRAPLEKTKKRTPT